MIIDIHTHAWPDKIADKAKETLEAFFKIKLCCLPTVNNLRESMQKNNIDLSAICAVASRPDQVSSINDWLFKIRCKEIRVFCAMHPGYKLWKQELSRIKDNGDGIKFQPEFQDFYIDHPKLYPLYQEIERLGLPVLFHCGEELSGTMITRSSPDRVLTVKEKFPGLKLIAAHFGGFQLWDQVEKYLLGKDIYLDTAFLFGFLPQAKIREMLLRHPAQRLLFGTDFPLNDQSKDLEAVRSLGLTQELLQRMLYLNSRELLGLD